MSEHRPRPIAEMRAAAERLVEELRPYCSRIEIAGSIRRGKPECADVELVCVPRMRTVTAPPGDLFGARPGEPVQVVDVLDGYVRGELAAAALVEEPWWLARLDRNGRRALGPRYKRLIRTFGMDPVPLDLFSVLPPASWGVIYLIRTGPSEFSRRMVTQRSRGGLLPNDCAVLDGAVWRDAAIPMPEEADFFALCGLSYVEPERRR